ncbi:MAG: hypothetical protein ABFS86_02420 [Planctomycetota bacterium]
MKRMLRWLPIFLALVLAASAGYYQRRTGPTHPIRGRLDVAGDPVRFRLPRSGTTGEDLEIEVPAARDRAVLRYRRYPTGDDWTEVRLAGRDGVLKGTLPSQPPAGKLEYRIVFEGGDLKLPADDPVVVRFKGAVPAWLLIPHIAAMFLSLVIGFRATFAALAGSPRLLRYTTWTAALLTGGGMFLGPCVQKYAFGAFWTGWPNGKDLTDNKMLLLWIVWIAALAVVRFARSGRAGRIAVVAATVVMIGVYLIPHSLRGSQLNYERLEDGVSVEEAIETG